MTRRIIWAKDDYFDHGDKRTDMDPAVVKFPEESIPIIVGFDWARGRPIGNITDLRLEEGEITGEVFWFEPIIKEQYDALLDHDDMFFGGYYGDVVMTNGNDTNERVLSCGLRAAGLVPGNGIGGVRKVATGANPGASL